MSIRSKNKSVKSEAEGNSWFGKEMGLSEDSIKGLETYKKCLLQGKKLHEVFTEDDIYNLDEELDHA